MADRAKRDVNHPTACTCTRCERDGAAGERGVRRLDSRGRQTRRVDHIDQGITSGRRRLWRARPAGGQAWLWAIAMVAILACGRDEVASVAPGTATARPIQVAPVAAIVPTQSPTPSNRETEATPAATTAIAVGTQPTIKASQDTPVPPPGDRLSPTSPVVPPTETPAPTLTPRIVTPASASATPTPSSPASTTAPVTPSATPFSSPAPATSTASQLSTATASPPSPTPTVALPSLRDFKNGAWLEQRHPRLADSIRTLDWVRDGIDDAEAEAVQDLLYIAVMSRSVTSSLVSMPWMQDGVTQVETGAIGWMNNFSAAEVASAVVSLGWMQDGVDAAEVRTLEELSYITNRDAQVGLSVASLSWVEDGLQDAEVDAINWVGNIAPADVASAVVSLGWMQDGVDSAEVKILEKLSYIANRDAQVGLSLVSLDWMQDGLEDGEVDAINWIGNTRDAEVASSALALGWVRDSVEAREITTIQQLSYLANREPAAAQRIVLMPFLNSIEPADTSAIESLWQLAAFDPAIFRSVISHPTLSSGITDELAPLVATLEGVAKTNPGLIGTLLEPGLVSLEQRTISLPLSGDVELVIMRTAPGAARSMDLLEGAVRGAEEFMGVELPTNYVGLLFEEAVVGSFAGTNFGTHIAILAKYDVNDGSREAEFASQSIAHEVAHYYWSGNADWIDEGAAELMAAVSESVRSGRPVDVTNYPCAYADNIADLVGLEAGRDAGEFRCNYSLGERIFVDLYETLGDEKFREGFRNLYLASEVEDDTDKRRGTSVDIAHLREALASSGDGAETVIARWYDGAGPHDLSRLDTGPADLSLPSISGRIDEAYVATSADGPPVSGFSAKEIADWVYLTLKYSYDVSGDPREVDIDIVEYYEDGFTFRRKSSTLTAEAKYIGGTSWFSVGASPTRKWAPGRYFVYVYTGDRKIAEVEYEVTP